MLGAALSYACAGIFGKRFKTETPLVTASCHLIAATVLLAPVVLFLDQPRTVSAVSSRALAAVVGLALISTALAYVIYFRILATSGATSILLVTLLIPVSAILLGTGLLGETLLMRHLVGMAAIGSALLILDGRLLRRIASAGPLTRRI